MRLKRGIPLIMLGVFFYGMVFYPDAPISQCGAGYCGKLGRLHTETQYRAFNVWQTTLAIVWVLGMASLFILNRIDKSRR